MVNGQLQQLQMLSLGQFEEVTAVSPSVTVGRSFVKLTGAQDVTTILGGSIGAILMLFGDGGTKLKAGGNLLLSKSVTLKPDTIVVLVYDGSFWLQTG